MQMNLFLKEDLLQYIWQHQYFNRQDLCSCEGEPIRIIHPGTWNRNQGPDFLNARIQIADNVWAGNVELHVRSSDWDRHGHGSDAHYGPVVLHVVWEADRVINSIPVLELNGRVPGQLLERYAKLMNQTRFVPCEDLLTPLPPLIWSAWRERLITGRLLRRNAEVELRLQQTEYNWEEICWQMIARNFGIRLNADVFEDIAKSLPLSKLRRCRHDQERLEALLLGQAGMLEQPFSEEYPLRLQQHYQILAKGMKLKPVASKLLFLRMRPANFPGIRLAQLSVLLAARDNLFEAFCAAASVDELRQMLWVTAGEYWNNHFRIGEPARFQPKQVGRMLADNIVLNTAVPLVFAYAQYRKDEPLLEKALNWLQQIPAESNHIIQSFQKQGLPTETAADSQALLELKRHYCEQHRCLDCSIGNFLLNRPRQ